MTVQFNFDKDKLMNLSFGEALKEIRYAEEMTTTDLSRKSNISQPYISQLENNVRVPSDKIIGKLALALAEGNDEMMNGIVKVSNSFYTPITIEKRQDELYKLLQQIKKNTQESKELSLDDFINGLDFDISKPLVKGEFITKYVDNTGNEILFGGNPKDPNGIFDLNSVIQNSYYLNEMDGNGFKSLGGATPLFYCGKKINHQDRIKIMKVLDAVFDIDREEYNKKIK
ncbi:helix-turn-helix transcriptional regulator [Vagococcus fluvialis]|uniref:helix-turn-helix transcriptional regulator n=1 Tax=Vagococcus fluvialis TaxID=2738 RepID=UPI0037CF8904